MKNNNYFKTWMRSLLTLLLIISSAMGFAQTVTITCTGITGSFQSGSVNAAGTMNDGNMITINSTTNRGWAHFDLTSIPASAIVSSVTANFTTYSSTASAALNNLYGFTGDPSATAGATLFTNCGSGLTFNNSAWTANSLQTKVLNSDGIAFIQSLVGTNNANIGYVRASTNTYNIGGYPGNFVAPPSLTIVYTIPTPCTGTPAPGNTLSSAASACSGASFTLSIQNAIAGTGVTYQWESADDNLFTVNVATLGTATTQVTSQTAAKYYHCLVTCSGNTTPSNALQVTMNTDPCTCISYCVSTHPSGCGTDYISRVKIPGTTLDNNNGICTGNVGSYIFYNGGGSQTSSLVIGDPYTLEITFGSDASQFSAFWIDYDNNGLFTDPGEFIAASAVSPGGGGTTSFTFTPLGSASVGSHRMRVMGGNDIPILSSEACGVTIDPFGETEDYCITLVAPTPCTGTPTAGTVVSNVNTGYGAVCPGANFTLSLTGTSTGSGLTYQWQSSPDNSTYTNIGGATLSTLTTNITSATWFKCAVTCSGNTGVSAGLQINTSAVACYCLGTTSLAGCTYGLDIESVIVSSINNQTTCGGSLPYMYSNFDYISGNVEQGLSYPITIGRSTFVTNACAFGVWVDWDNNNSFNDVGEYMVILLTGGAGVGQQSNTGTLVVPPGASLGPHRMRIRSNFSVDPGQASVCTNYGNPSEQEDYTLNVVGPCTGTPIAGTTASFSNLACPSVPFTLYIQGAGAALGLTYQWQSSPDNTTFTDIVGATGSTRIQTQSTATYYRCRITCSNGGGFAYSISLLMNNNTFANCICNTPVYSSVGCTGTTANNYIGQVTFAGINNTTGCGATSPNYQFFPAQIASVNQTVTYPVTISTPAAGAAFQRFKVYIDFNDNASFDDAGETVYNSGPISTSVNISTGNISIAANAALGSHRLRVRSTNPLSTSIDANSCSDDGFFGEVEDYLITISGPPPCTGTPTPGQTLASTPLACASTSINLSLQNATSGAGVTYQWQSSLNAGFTSPVNLGTLATETVTETATTWYRCIVTCSGNDGISTPVQVSYSVPCYCTNPVHGSDGCGLGLYIDNFTFAGINNTSGCYSSVPYTTPFYSYFPNAIATAQVGVDYPYSITTPAIGVAYTQFFGIWIDFDNNGSFDDAGEFIASTTTSTAVNTFSGNYTIPLSAPVGMHKMRIRSGNAAPINSCAAASSGETEDYLINIVLCTGTPDPGNTVSSVASACPEAPFTLSLQNLQTSLGITYQWQSAPSSTGVWSNLGTDNDSLSTLQSSVLWYQCVVTCSTSGLSATSTATQVLMNIAPGPKIVEEDTAVCGNSAGFYLHVKDSVGFPGGYPTGTYFEWVNYTPSTLDLDSLLVNSSDDYKVVITLPGGGCSDTSNIIHADFTGAQAPVPLLNQDSVKCVGGESGSAMVHLIVGGNPMMNYKWYNSSNVLLRNVTTSFGDDTLKNVAAGDYTVVVYNNVGTTILSCGETGTVTVLEPTAISISAVVTNVTCKNAHNGIIAVTPSGGSPGYSYIWNTVNTNGTRTGLYPGNYTVSVTDSHGCYGGSLSMTVLQSATQLAANVLKTNVKCGGKCTGTATASPVGGTSPYKYNWSNGSTNISISSLCAGTYTLSVTDAYNCVRTIIFSITQNPPLVLVVAPSGTNQATASVSGGMPGYTYLWNTNPPQATSTAFGLAPGQTYKVHVTDSKGCTKNGSVAMPLPRNSSIGNSIGTTDFNIFPNPSSGMITITFNNTSDIFDYMLHVYDITNRVVYSKTSIHESGIKSTDCDFSTLSKGIYTLNISTEKGTQLIKIVLQ